VNRQRPTVGPRRCRLRLEVLETRALLTTFTVVNTGFTGTGAGTSGDLVYCLNQVNADGPGLDTIRFAIPGAGVHTISATATLGVIHPVVIEGLSQGGLGYSGAPLIELDGSLAGGSIGLYLTAAAAGSTIRGLAIDHYGGSGLRLDGANNTLVQGNYIGVTPAGAAAGNGNQGIRMTASGCTLLDNVISNNALTGVWMLGDSTGNANNNLFQGNRIGTDPGGSVAMPNGNQAVLIQGAAPGTANNTTFGGTAAGQGNIVAASTLFGPGSGHGLVVAGLAAGTLVEGNDIGTNSAGANLGNAGDGVLLTAGASGSTVAGNVIAFNAKGVVVASNNSTGNRILGNSIHDNLGPGIDLGDDGVTPNSTSPPGPNDFQHHPVLTDASGGSATGFLPGATASTPYRIEFFASPAAGPPGQGETFLGFANVTGTGGNTPFSAASAAFPAGWVVTATATDLGNGDTSEFSAGPPVSISLIGGNNQSTTVATGFPAPLQVLVRDAYANPIEGLTVTFTGPGLSGAAGVAVTDTTGTASFAATAGTMAGNYQVLAAAGSAAPAVFDLANVAGPASTFVVNSPSQSETGVSFGLTVRAVDQYGNTATTYSGTVGFVSSDPRAMLPGAFTFTAADAGMHVFSNVVLRSLGTQTVTVADQSQPALRATSLVLVFGTPPTVIVPGAGLTLLTVGHTMIRTGSFTDPDPADTFTAVVDYGDGSGPMPLALAANGSFTLAHHYAREGNFPVSVRVTDSEGLVGSASFLVAAYISGIKLGQVGVGTAAPGHSVTVSAPGITAILFRSAQDADPGGLLVVPVPVSVARGLSATSPAGRPTVSAAYDVRGINLTAADTAVVTFAYPGGGVGLPVLRYFDPARGTFLPVHGSSLAPATPRIDTRDRLITVVFDRTSRPALTSLTGTVFTVSVALPVQEASVAAAPVSSTVQEAVGPALPEANVLQAAFIWSGNTGLATGGVMSAAASEPASSPVSSFVSGGRFGTAAAGLQTGGGADLDERGADDRGILPDLPAVGPLRRGGGGGASLLLSPSQASFPSSAGPPPPSQEKPTVPSSPAESRSPRQPPDAAGQQQTASQSEGLDQTAGEDVLGCLLSGALVLSGGSPLRFWKSRRTATQSRATCQNPSSHSRPSSRA
jgi:parallel beta-helix repeat protein